jgi:hypothetical protein
VWFLPWEHIFFGVIVETTGGTLFMKRLIIHLIVAMVTFSIGAAAELLLTVNDHTVAPRLSAIGPSVRIAQESLAQSSVTDLVCDYEPEEFNPRGDYYILGHKPKKFREFDCFELRVDQGRASGAAMVQTYSNQTYNAQYAVSGLVTKKSLTFVAIPLSEEDFEYSFAGVFLRAGVLSSAGRNEAVLKGKLTKSKGGAKIAECDVKFRVEYLGC